MRNRGCCWFITIQIAFYGTIGTVRLVPSFILGFILCGAIWTAAAQNERAAHPRIAKAIAALTDAEAYLKAAPHEFGGHKAAAVRAIDNAVTELELALTYRAGADRRR